MAVRVALEHCTVYRFDRSVEVGPHVIRLRPAPHCRTPVTGYSLRVHPGSHFVNWQQDVYGNHAARLVFREPTDRLEITVDLVADLSVINPFDFFIDAVARHYPFEYPEDLAGDLRPYLHTVAPSEPVGGAGRRLRDWLAGIELIGEKDTPIVDFLVVINQRVAAAVNYTVRLEEGVQSPATTLARGVGSCRDSAWLLVAALRELGLAARFVSGYLIQLAPDDASGPVARDFADLHAWAEVYLPGAGWIGLDATSGLLAGEGHIPLVGAPRPEAAAPITGTTGTAQTTMDFSTTVRRIREDPRVTRPYEADQLRAIHSLGELVDARLEAGDVRLTMGGEPTFVAADDMDSAQWRIAADGADKRRYAVDLARRLATLWAPHGIIHHGQGKWYPGEALPRWQATVIWRADDIALWSDPALLDEPWGEGAAPAEAAAALTGLLATWLGVPADCVKPLYEDPLDRLAAEARLPAGEPAPLPWLTAPPTADERLRLVAELDAERGEPVAWAIPLHWSEERPGWTTTRWSTRRGEVFLRPGTSPAGLRLPLDSIAWNAPPAPPDRSPAAPLLPLPAQPAAQPWSAGHQSAALILEAADAPTTALCVQDRSGHLFVFLPPLPDAEACVALLHIVEQAAAALGTAVVLEGYPPTGDQRFRSLSVTPDPGVLEVNVHPAASWTDLVEINTTLDTAARELGLATETFAMDGTHTGTGGGSHLTLGGRSPVDSPLLRRPDLLVSMLTYWQHHPGLSYLFSGRFIGPTSQCPRVDEARHDTLYELEIAFGEIAALAATEHGALPWQVDRALRHLLTDMTGNTHRSEFCIDKLFSPDSERGRLGLLELRGFEMPPHPTMSLVQALLVRALVARFWAAPYTGPLVRWGARLHDEFLLPAYALADLADVVADLNAHGLAFDVGWLAPFAEFRFPRLGTVTVSGVQLELRAAIEPWHVLGEEVTGSGTARYVDSSCERVQLAVTGAVPGRHLVTCNSRPLPLAPVRTPNTLVAGVRFKAWAPHSALHPTVPVHSPLVFDVIDTWNARSLGGFTHHVVHPGGRSHDRFPVNAAEAEARRGARFVPGGHTPGQVDPTTWQAAAVATTAPEYPRTLDLRR